MRFSTSGFSSLSSFVPHTISRAVTLGVLLPATLLASTAAFAQVPPPA
jgi:D-alanyl-D-alanine carboxypeptidase (penicillin-binding protein 5/6)